MFVYWLQRRRRLMLDLSWSPKRVGAAMSALIIAGILYLSLAYVCGRFTADYAARRGRSRSAWFFWGALFYPFPYIVLALMKPKNPRDPRPEEDRRSTGAQQQKDHLPSAYPRMTASAIA